MLFQEQVNRLSRWFFSGIGIAPALCGASSTLLASDAARKRGASGCAGSAAVGRATISRAATRGSAVARTAKRPAAQRATGLRATGQRAIGQRRKQTRTALLEAMEPRYMMAADMIQVGAVYNETDLSGGDAHGDLFYISFKGGAPDTQMTRLTIDGDQNTPGFGLGDMFFDTVAGGLGADHAFPFQIIQLKTQNPNATVKATVHDGDTKLVLDFTNFTAGDLLVFSIDVDEVQDYDPSEKDLTLLNDGFDPIASGVEFQNSKLSAEFTAPHYEFASGQDKFLNRYDPWLVASGLDLPADDEGGFRDRTAGGGFALQQVPKPISLAGTVYVDANEDLTLQAGEQRLSGVKLDLYRLENGNYVATGNSTTTDSQGRYVFGTNLGLMPGTYQVRESQPAGYYSVGASAGKLNNGTSVGHIVAGNPDVLTQVDVLLGDQHATELNFAENLPASISGHTCVVVSGFDCFSSSSEKAPLAGVLIELRNASGQVIATQTTGADGKYLFANLRAGVYSLTETTPAALLEGDSKVGSSGGVKVNGSQISQITIGGGVTATDYDFCELTPSDLSGHTFYDQNNNGRRDSGELPLSSVLVTLWDDAGSKVAEMRTNSQGYYQFNRLRPGTYRVTEQTPSEYLPGQAAVGTVSGKTVGSGDASGDVLSAIVLPAGSHGIDYDFGEILPGSIAGRVISDTNGNCIIDATGDRPLAGVTIELLSATGAVLQTTLTDAQGNYKFDNLLPAEYAIREVQPVGYFQGDHHAGSGGGDASVADLVRAIYVTPGAALIDYNFCEIPPGSIAGQVYVDADQDCEYDSGEAPIAGVTITLLDDSGRVVRTTHTDATGRYQFIDLTPGKYTVRESQPAGYLQGGQTAGSGGGDTSVPDVISAIQLGAGTALVDYDFCELLPGSIAGVVFADLDFDCVLDANESTLSGVKVELLDTAGLVIASTLTDASGKYSFTNLRPGQYAVRETQPLGYFQGGQVAPKTGGDASLDDLISQINVGSGQAVTDANFCEVPPAKISGYVFQDGSVIASATGELPDDIRSIRDGLHTSDDTPIGNVILQLRALTGQAIDASRALPGVYSGQTIEVRTDANGYFEFTGLRAGTYHVYEKQPDGYIDSLDTPGTTTGFAINRGEAVPASIMSLIQLTDPQANPGTDAILAISVEAGQHSSANNFSEVQTKRENPAPPISANPPSLEKVFEAPPVYQPQAPIYATPLLWAPLPLLIGYGHQEMPTWHLSVINGGFPRGMRNGEPVEESQVAEQADRLNVYAWSVRGLKDSTWHIVSTNPRIDGVTQRMVFDLPGAQPLAGDFNGDGFDELALFLDGEWFIDINANGRWDENDIWLRLGKKGDQPVIGDWDGDGKDDVGIFGQKWQGDDRAIASEPGLPDPQNRGRVAAKNVPPTPEQATEDPRLLKRSHRGIARADLIDHVFRFGGEKDIAISGDFNGDGIATIGTYNNGRWLLDVDGDGKLSDEHDEQRQFGEPGDLPLVGDFDGDGIDELAVVRGDQVLVDSNANGRFDATDQVFQLDSAEGTVVVGDFNGDGRDEPALHQSVDQQRWLEAKREGVPEA